MNRLRNQPSLLQQLLTLPFNKRSVNVPQPTNQGSLLQQGISTPLAEPDVFERIEEYQAILEHQAQLSARRQHTNDVYIGLNTVFLTALGVLLLQSHLDTWWVFAVVCAITIIILPINITWQTALIRYGKSVAHRYNYLREIEQEFRARRGKIANQPEIGLFLRLNDAGLHQKGKGNTRLEIQLATYFIYLYPIISLIVGILVYLIQAHILAPLNIV